MVGAFALSRGGDSSESHTGRLGALVPFFDSWGCKATGSTTPAIVEQASCAPREGAGTAQLTLFRDQRRLQAAYQDEIRRADARSPSPIAPNTGKCNLHDWGGEAEWTYGRAVGLGRELCYITAEPFAYLIWTYDSVPLLVSAHRDDPLHDRLDNWFDDVALAIGPSAHDLETMVPLFAEWGCHAIASGSPALDEEAVCSPSEASHGEPVRTWRDRGAQSVVIRLFKDPASVPSAYARELRLADASSPSAVRPNSGTCDREAWSGEVQWYHAPNFPGGRRLCYTTRTGVSRLVWTYDGAPLLITAARSNRAHDLLLGWFNAVAHDIAFFYERGAAD